MLHTVVLCQAEKPILKKGKNSKDRQQSQHSTKEKNYPYIQWHSTETQKQNTATTLCYSGVKHSLQQEIDKWIRWNDSISNKRIKENLHSRSGQ